MEKIGDKYTNNTFENIKHIDDYGNEFWFARELQKVLEYKDWRNFQKVIDKAILSANNSVSNEEDWVVEVNKPIKTGKGKEEFIKDYKLSRYICYLIVQNADPSKEVVALGQTYFAIQTRKQEITEQEYDSLSDDEKRFYQRKLTKQGNYTLQKVASSAGVKNMAEFHNAGYKGLYNGETADDIFKRKKLRYREDILDNMNEDELVANLFRINQTKQRLIRDNVQGEKEAKDVHYEVDKIKEEYSKKISDRITTYKDLVLESFVEFYGEDYRDIITTRFNDISFIYYINDITIFYIVDSLKQGYNDKFKNIMFAIPYIVHLIKNNFYKQEITPDNFYELGMNKIVGVSDEILLSDKELLMYSIATALREKNEGPYEVNFPINNGFKRIIALPIFSVDDESLFHEINHAISSEIVTKNGQITVKCGLDYENEEKKYYNEILNDIISLEVYNIFKQKCGDNILEDNIMDEVLFNTYIDYHHLITEFYEKNKMRIKSSFIDFNALQLEKQDLEYLSNLKKQQGIER